MSIARKHFVRVTDSGRLEFYNRPVFDDNLLALRGKECEIVIRERIDYATHSQYKYYRGYILPTLAEAYGTHDTDVIHNDLLSRLEWQSSAGRSKKDMSKLIELAKEIGRDQHNIHWIEPSEVDYGRE